VNSATEVHADGFLHARLVADDLSGADAADRDLALTGTQVRDIQARDVAGDIDQVGRARLREVLRRERGDRERHVLQRRRAFLRGDDDFLVDVVVGGLRVLSLRDEWGDEKQRGGAASNP